MSWAVVVQGMLLVRLVILSAWEYRRDFSSIGAGGVGQSPSVKVALS